MRPSKAIIQIFRHDNARQKSALLAVNVVFKPLSDVGIHLRLARFVKNFVPRALVQAHFHVLYAHRVVLELG